jgi:hypothetical protein
LKSPELCFCLRRIALERMGTERLDVNGYRGRESL